MSYLKLLYLFVLFNLLNDSELVAQDSINDYWVGWRGQNFGSVELKSPPIIWDINNNTNISWKSSIQGEGHSSPITDGKFVYITSSSKSNLNLIVGNTFTFLEVFLVIVLIYFTLRNEVFQTSQYKSHITFFALTISILIFLLFILVLGDGYFNYSRCNLRVWFITTVIYTLLMIFFFMQLLINKLVAKKFMLFLIIIFPMFLFLIMPSKSHVFRNGIFNNSSLTAIGALIIPFFILLFLYIQSINYVNTTNKTIRLTKPLLLKRIQLFLAISFVLFFIIIITFYYIYPQSEEAKNINYRTFIPIKWTFVIALSILILISIHKYKNQKKRIILIIIIVLSNFMLFSILEKLLPQFSFFRYQLGNQKIKLLTNDFIFNIGYIPLIISLITLGYLLIKKYKPIQISIPFVIISLFIIQNFLFNRKIIYSRNVLCYDIKTGEKIWSNSIAKDTKYEIHNNNSLATPTSTIIDNYVISYFGNCGLICVNKTSGKTEWINKGLTFNSYYGVASSPIQHKNKIYLIHGSSENQLITSINYQNGDIVWQSEIKNKEIIYRPPLIRKIGDKYSIICISNNRIWIFKEEDGELIISREFENLGGDAVSSIIPDFENQNLIYVSGRLYTIAINLEKIFNDDFVSWKTKRIGSNCTSPVVYKSFLFILSDNGLLSCLNKNNGELLYKKKLSGYYYSSVCRAGNYLYLTNLDGVTYVLEIGLNKFIEKSINVLNEKVYASSAFANNKLIFRTFSNLVLIE